MMDLFYKNLTFLIKWIGEKSSWLNIVLIFLVGLDILQRYFFSQTYNWVIESEWHLFGLIFLLGSAFTLQSDKHVRVDVFYHKFKDKTKAIINLAGTLILLLPWCYVGIKTCYKYAANSWYIRESSPNAGGLPAWYVIKFGIVVCFVLLLLQGCLFMYRDIKSILK